MKTEQYYHMFANGNNARNFILRESESVAAFNRFAICSWSTGTKVLSFSIENTHPHALLKGTLQDCLTFKQLYEDLSIRSIVRRRGSKDGVELHCELCEITDEQYLMNVAIYTIVQPTKDGRGVMPYDYLYGTGPLYFRDSRAIMPWMVDNDGRLVEPRRFADLLSREKIQLCPARFHLPGDWLVSNGFILPQNYVDVKQFESIFRTHNCFSAFLASGKARDEQVVLKMASVSGVVVDDFQAQQFCDEMCREMFGMRKVRELSVLERVKLVVSLRTKYGLSVRQLSSLVRIPVEELSKYMR